MAMYKIGIIGERNSVLGFMALGFSVHEAATVDQAAQKLHTLVKSGEYAVIFLTEDYAAQLEEETNVGINVRCVDLLVDALDGKIAEPGPYPRG